MSISQLAPKSMGQAISTLFKSQEKFDQYEDIKGIILTNQTPSWEIWNYIFASIKRIK